MNTYWQVQVSISNGGGFIHRWSAVHSSLPFPKTPSDLKQRLMMGRGNANCYKDRRTAWGIAEMISKAYSALGKKCLIKTYKVTEQE